MKAVLASLKPYFYYLVGEGIKTIEVRKTSPKAVDWNKDTFFYMSRDEKSFAEIPKEFQEKYRKHFGKVGLRFVCDNILDYTLDPYGHHSYFISDDDFESTCLTFFEELWDYGKGKTLYGWHITDLVIYDKPRDLWRFCKPCDPHPECDCEYCITHGRSKSLQITRPPQSWCYCEEVNDV